MSTMNILIIASSGQIPQSIFYHVNAILYLLRLRNISANALLKTCVMIYRYYMNMGSPREY